jgi:hypothetical protein
VEQKKQVMILVLVEAAKLRWFVASLGSDGGMEPLLRSEIGDLEKCRYLDLDEQVSFLRHRLCGAFQRGCDRIWGRGSKACQFIVIFAGSLPDSTGPVIQGVADHLTQWLLNPPLAVFSLEENRQDHTLPTLDQLAGRLESSNEEILRANLSSVLDARADARSWELVPKKTV